MNPLSPIIDPLAKMKNEHVYQVHRTQSKNCRLKLGTIFHNFKMLGCPNQWWINTRIGVAQTT